MKKQRFDDYEYDDYKYQKRKKEKVRTLRDDEQFDKQYEKDRRANRKERQGDYE